MNLLGLVGVVAIMVAASSWLDSHGLRWLDNTAVAVLVVGAIWWSVYRTARDKKP